VNVAVDSLLSPILDASRHDPERSALVFVRDDGREERVSAGRLAGEVERYAAALSGCGARPGEPVLLLLPHSLELTFVFWGALRLGALPSIFPGPTEKLDPAIYRGQLRALMESAGASLVVAGADLLPEVSPGPGRAVTVETLLAATPGSVRERVPGGDDPAALIYSSGTTGLQKGIAHSHRAILAQLEVLVSTFRIGPDDVVASWLPLFHDLGLITTLFLPAVAGIPVVHLSPFAWARSPGSFLRAIQSHRGTLTWTPNFALNHTVRSLRDKDREGLDLSSLRLVVVSAEPVRAASLASFRAALEPYGFQGTLAAGYGMTEISGPATLTRLGEEPRVDRVAPAPLLEEGRAEPCAADAPGAVTFVSNGRPVAGVTLRIVDDGGRPVGERRVGEIELRSGFVLDGYHRRPDLTAQVIRDGWYVTGDMGYLVEGELYVCGRKKDLIIVGGKNLYPDDVEAAVQLTELRPGRVVAFGVPDEALGTEGLVVVAELREPLPPDRRRALEIEVRRRVLTGFGVVLSAVLLVPSGWVIKTSNGKIARAANREKFERSQAPL